MLDSFRNKVSNSMLQSSIDSGMRRQDNSTNQHEESKDQILVGQSMDAGHDYSIVDYS